MYIQGNVPLQGLKGYVCARFPVVSLVFLLLCGVVFSGAAFAAEALVVYTGNAQGTLYPCGTCPETVGGGVSRRAAAIAKVRAHNQNTLVVDAGNYTAGGLRDQSSINPVLDKLRTQYYYEAMAQMGYDAVALGEAEFTFGLPFLQENINKSPISFVSANLELEGVKPYVIKKMEGVTIGIVGLTPMHIQKKTGLVVNEYQSSLRDVLQHLEKEVDVIVLLSPLGESMSRRLSETFPQIQLVVVSDLITSRDDSIQVNETRVVYPSLRAKTLGQITITVEGNNILLSTPLTHTLGTQQGEDAVISKLIPSCFADNDCLVREGLTARCQNGGKVVATCAYYEVKKIAALLISDTQCSLCATKPIEGVLKQVFEGVEFEKVDYQSAQGKELIERYHIRTLPAFLLPESIKEERHFTKLEKFLVKRDGQFLVSEGLSGIFLYLDRDPKPRQIDLFVHLYKDGAAEVFDQLTTFAQAQGITLTVHFIIPTKPRISYLSDEVLIALAVRKLYPEQFAEYLSLRLERIKSLFLPDILAQLGMDYAAISALAQSPQGQELLNKDQALVHELGIAQGNILLVTNNRIFDIINLQTSDLQRFFEPGEEEGEKDTL